MVRHWFVVYIYLKVLVNERQGDIEKILDSQQNMTEGLRDNQQQLSQRLGKLQ